MHKVWVRWALLLVAVSPALLPLLLILEHSVDMPWWDHWNPFTAGLYIKAHQGQLTLHDLLALQNEHRPVVPRLIYLGLNVFTHWNTTVECLLEWCFVSVVSFNLFRLLRSTEGRGSVGARTLVLWFLCNLMLFTPAQWENWLFGMGLVNITPMLWITSALVVIAARLRPWPTVIVAMLLSTAATYSNGCGLFYWPLIAVLLAWSGSRAELRSKRPILLTYAVWAVINIALYFVGYTRPTHGGAGFYTTDPAKLAQYTLAFLGNAFAFRNPLGPEKTALVCGSVLLALFLAVLAYFVFVWLKAKDYEVCRRMLFWIIVGGTSVLNASISSFSRAGGGLLVATSSRYVTFSLFLPVALVVLVPIVCDDLRQRAGRKPIGWLPRACARVPALLGSALVLVWLAALPDALTWSATTERGRREGKAALLLLDALPDDPHLTDQVCAELDLITTQAPVLNQMGYLHPPLIAGNDARSFETDPAAVGGAKGDFDRIWQLDAVSVATSGWAIVPDRTAPADAVFLTYEDATGRSIIFTLARMGRLREDVVALAGDPGYAYGGWVAIFARDRLPPSPLKTTITAWALDTETGKACRLAGAKPVEL